jgi:hypothetical protein|tara:strand:- start:2669 stop:3184 length:516 start_codon:yes stop_codon:yes gene_type:complete
MEDEEEMGGGTGGTQTNNNQQIGLINANAQLNVSLIDTGGAAGGIAAGGGLLGTAAVPATATGFAAAVPVIGQVIAIGAAIVGIVQIFDTAQKQANMADSILSAKTNQKLLAQELAAIGLEYSEKLEIIKEDIAYREQALETNKKLIVYSLSALGVAAMIFTYSIIKLNKK